MVKPQTGDLVIPFEVVFSKVFCSAILVGVKGLWDGLLSRCKTSPCHYQQVFLNCFCCSANFKWEICSYCHRGYMIKPQVDLWVVVSSDCSVINELEDFWTQHPFLCVIITLGYFTCLWYSGDWVVVRSRFGGSGQNSG